MERLDVLKSFKVDSIRVKIYETILSVGQAAANFVTSRINKAIDEKGKATIILATGASQFTFLDALKRDNSIDWAKITVFHLDEYVGLSENHPASFRRYLRERILDEVKPGEFYFLNGDVNDIETEIARYENLLKTNPIDVACIGIGENGHIAFNDPPIADFNDTKLVKVVELDQVSRMQQVGEGWFATIDDVPKQALSLTIPAIMNAKTISCVVPEERKAEPVYKTLYGPICTDCPASILRKHPDAILFLDRYSASKLPLDEIPNSH